MIDSITRIVRDLDPPRYTTNDAAELVGRSAATLRRWRQTGYFQPSDSKMFGELEVFLYTPEDITELKKIAYRTRQGRRAIPRPGEAEFGMPPATRSGKRMKKLRRSTPPVEDL